MRRWLIGLLFFAITGAVAAQEISNVPMRMLENAGIDKRTFTIIHTSEDGHQVLGWDRPNVTLKRKGQKVRLWLLDFDSAFKLKESKSYGMDLASLEQAQFTPDGKGVVLISRQGTEFYKLNLADGVLTPIMRHVTGEAGFRGEPQILNWTEGRLITTGFLYDEKNLTQETGVAFVNPDATGVAAFTPGPTFGKVEQEVPGLLGSVTISPRVLYFWGKQGQESTVYAWTPAEGLKPIDKGDDVLGWWGEQAKFLYTIARAGSNELVLYDGLFGRRQVLATTTQPYESLSLSRDGSLALGCLREGKDKMSVVAFQEKSSWQPRQILKSIPLSILRTSPDGNVVAAYDPSKGLTLVKL